MTQRSMRIKLSTPRSRDEIFLTSDDQLYMPLFMRWEYPTYANVFIDECQDLVQSSISCWKSLDKAEAELLQLVIDIKRSMGFEALTCAPWTISRPASECLNYLSPFPTGVTKMSSKKLSNTVIRLDGEMTRVKAPSSSVPTTTHTKIRVSSSENSSCAETTRRSFERFFATLERNLPAGSFRISLTLSRDLSKDSESTPRAS